MCNFYKYANKTVAKKENFIIQKSRMIYGLHSIVLPKHRIGCSNSVKKHSLLCILFNFRLLNWIVSFVTKTCSTQ